MLTFNSMSQNRLLPVPAVPLFVNQQGLRPDEKHGGCIAMPKKMPRRLKVEE